MKSSLTILASRLARLHQIHIIGCSRSGTTMLHLAMGGFRDTIVPGRETDAGYPFLRDYVRMIPSGFGKPERTIITKRSAHWFEPHQIARFRSRATLGRIGLIHMVRDPRDVLDSRHGAQTDDAPYVTPDHWMKSVRAAEQMMDAIGSRGPLLTIRFEDFVTDPTGVQSLLIERLGLRLHPRVTTIGDIKNNLAVNPISFDAYYLDAVHSLRNADPASAGKWKKKRDDPLEKIDDPVFRESLSRFLDQHGYTPLPD